MLSSERVILANFDDENESEDDLYKGYNDFNPVLDTRNIQEDDLFKETIHKSSYGRAGGLGHRTNTSTAGVAFNRATALKSRRTGRGTGGGGKTGIGSVAGGTAAGNRPLTAVRGAGYTSHGSGGAFDPLGLASSMAQVGGKASGFHLQDENTPELKIKQLEAQINRLMEESVNAAERKEFGVSLDLAKDCVSKERSLNRMKEQSNLMEQFGPNSDLTLAVIFNLAEQYCNSRMWPEAINTYQSILKNRSFTNTGRLRMNIGEIYFRQNQYPKAIKFFRMALDQVPNTQTELRLKLMQNIGLSFVRLTQFADAIASFEYIASERGDLDPQTAFHLIVCYFAMGDNDKMKYYFGKLLSCKVEDQFEERYGHHEILTNGGNIFASSINGHDSPMDLARSTPSGDHMNSSGVATSGRVSSPVLLIRDEHDHHNNLLIEAIRNDRLRAFEKEKIQHVEWCVLTAAKLIAPYIESSSGAETSGSSAAPAAGGQYDLKAAIDEAIANGSVGAGYDWCLDQIRKMMNAVMTGSASMNGSGSAGSGTTAICALNFSNMADELELYKAVKHLRAREFDQAIGTLKLFEKKDKLVTSVSSARAEVGGGGGHPPLRSVTSASGGFASSPIVNSSSTPTLPNPSTSVTPTHGHRLTTSTSSNSRVAATAATNLSFLYLLQHELDIAGRYADEAIGADRYCTGALLNRGNVYFHQGDYARALDYYRDVINSNPTCLEAYFNLALAERKLGNHDKALESLFRLRTITKMPSNHHTVLNQKISNTIEVNLLYQIASIYESMENIDQATDFYQQVLNMIPTDVSLLVKMADIATDGNDRKQALTYLMEAYRYLPSHIPTIERLAAYYIEVKMYEKAIKYLEQLANNQPNQIKWQLMIAASYRRAGSYQQAFSMYQTIHGRFPDNVDCLKFLIRICAELDAEGRANSTGGGKSYAQLGQQYSDTLKRLEKSRELREQQAIQQQQSNSRSASRASANPGRMGSQYGRNNGQSASSREGSAATSNSSSGGSISSGYITSKTPTKSNGTSPSSGRRSGVAPSPIDPSGMPNRSSISAIVDQVVEQLDSTTLNERPTTSWSRRRFKNAVRSASMMASSDDDPQGAGQGNGDYDEDMLLDANLDDILPD